MVTSALIATICIQASIPGQYQAACSNAATAAAKQSGVETVLETSEQRATTQLTNLVVEYTGKDILAVAGVSYKIYREKAIQYTIPTHRLNKSGLIPSITPRYDFNQNHAINFNWGWSF